LVTKGRLGKSYCHKLVSGEGRDISDYEMVYVIDKLKEVKNAQIDKRTEELIYSGHLFDDHLFDTSAESQRDWLGLYSLINDISFPFAVTTKDEKEYFFQNAQTYVMFFKMGTVFINNTIGSGRAIKLKVMACTTKDEIDAIIDAR